MYTFDIKSFSWNKDSKKFFATEWDLLPNYNELDSPEERIGDSFKIKNFETGQEREFLYESMNLFDQDEVSPHTVSTYICKEHGLTCEIVG
jgi:hypothetical protein